MKLKQHQMHVAAMQVDRLNVTSCAQDSRYISSQARRKLRQLGTAAY